MFLAYLDESGGPSESLFVVGGVVVHERDSWRLNRILDGVADRLPDRVRGGELHASNMISGRGPWRGVPRSDRDAAFSAMADLAVRPPADLEHPPVLFAVVMDRPERQRHDPIERTYEELFGRCNGFLKREAALGNRHLCLPIADKSDKVERRLQGLMQLWREGGATTGASIGPLAGFAEVPVFIDSRMSRLIQFADFVCNAVFRHYAGLSSPAFERILDAFDSEDGVRHGLVHLVAGYQSCPCPACGSRR